MANIKSQIKRNRTNEARRLRNKSVRSALKSGIKGFSDLVASGDLDGAETARRAIGRQLDRAASAGVIHANKAANHKSAMATTLTAAVAGGVAGASEPPTKKKAAPARKGAAGKAKAASSASPKAKTAGAKAKAAKAAAAEAKDAPAAGAKRKAAASTSAASKKSSSKKAESE